MDPLSDEKILDSWHKNVTPWTNAISKKQITSRELVTDQAIVDIIEKSAPKQVLDIGCGEGWLTHKLAEKGYHSTGIDGVAGLIEQAKLKRKGHFEVVEYESLHTHEFNQLFDLAVCNFSLLGQQAVESVFNAVPKLLIKNGSFIIQTLHPFSSCGDLPYQDGWRQGSWQGFSEDFVDPAPWYFRTLNSWITLFNDNHFQIKEILEPINPINNQPASLMIKGTKNN